MVGIVEDDPGDYEALARVLGGRYATCHWPSGREALDELTSPAGLDPRFVVLVVDLGLPDMHGADVIRAVRGAPGGGGPAIFALTGSDSDADRAAVDAAGADDYFVKPSTVAGLRGIAAAIADVVSDPHDDD